MDFTSTDLLPTFLRDGQSTRKQVSYHLPLTPFFNDPATLATVHSRGFHGKNFWRQYKNTALMMKGGRIEDEPICGFAAYRTLTSVDLDESEENLRPYNGTSTSSYVFDVEENEVRVENEVTGRPRTSGNTHTRTASTALSGDPFEDPPTHIEITLSDAVDKAWLEGELDRWLAMPDAFIEATGSGLGTYSGGEGAIRTERDGAHASIGGGICKAEGPWFTGVPYGMVGNAGTKWNGKFSTYIGLVTRKNAPCIYDEAGIRDDGVVIPPSRINPVATGMSIYKQGYFETALSDPVGHLWADELGVYDSSNILDVVPLSAVSGWDGDFEHLLHYHNDGEANELTLISRTGKNYRVTLQAGYENAGTWVTLESFVMTTGPSLTVVRSFAEVANASELRASLIEEERIVDGHAQWVVVADGDAARSRIGSSITDDCLLLAATKRRTGSRFGFLPLIYDSPTWHTDRYRKKTFRMHVTTGDLEAYTGECGVSGLTGSAELVWTEEYDRQTGILLPIEIKNWSASLNGVTWTPETPDVNITGWQNFSETVRSATLIRMEGEYTWIGAFVIGFDAPDENGKITSTDWVRAGMNATGGKNQTSAIGIHPPSSGHSRFFEGHRLTYTD